MQINHCFGPQNNPSKSWQTISVPVIFNCFSKAVSKLILTLEKFGGRHCSSSILCLSILLFTLSQSLRYALVNCIVSNAKRWNPSCKALFYPVHMAQKLQKKSFFWGNKHLVSISPIHCKKLSPITPWLLWTLSLPKISLIARQSLNVCSNSSALFLHLGHIFELHTHQNFKLLKIGILLL